MIKQIAWNTFKNTGNINTFLELKEIANLEEKIRMENNEIVKNQGNNNCRKDSIRF